MNYVDRWLRKFILSLSLLIVRKRNNVQGVVSGYRLNNRGILVVFEAWTINYSLLQSVQTVYGALIRGGGSNAAGDRSWPLAEVMHVWSYSSFRTIRLRGVSRGNVTPDFVTLWFIYSNNNLCWFCGSLWYCVICLHIFGSPTRKSAEFRQAGTVPHVFIVFLQWLLHAS